MIVNANRTTIVVKSPQKSIDPLCALRKRPNTPEYGL
jgi:hypothetical protein